MSTIFRKVFGVKKGEAANDTNSAGAAIQKLREMEELLGRKQDHLESKIEEEVATARKLGVKNKRAAIQALKRKKRYQQQLQQIDGTLTTIEMQREALEAAKTNTDVLKTMSEAAKSLKSAQLNMDVDKVHDMMDDIAEQQEVAREISDAISNPIAFTGDVDEDELEAELEKLEQEELDNALLSVTAGPSSTAKKPDTLPDLPLRPSGSHDGGESSISGDSGPSKKAGPANAKKGLSDEEEESIKQLETWAAT